MPRITVAVSEETHKCLVEQESQRGISISRGANQLIELALKERKRRLRKRKTKQDGPEKTTPEQQ